jgi:hypothetical protein
MNQLFCATLATDWCSKSARGACAFFPRLEPVVEVNRRRAEGTPFTETSIGERSPPQAAARKQR